MSYFLWVEDFESLPKATASDVFGNVFKDDLFFEDKRELKISLKDQGVYIQLNLQDGLGFITPDLDQKIDYIILDIDLPVYSGDGINAEVLDLLETFHDYQKQADEKENEAFLIEKSTKLKEIAGFHLYTKLVVELGFPKQHILFCSNHGENTKTIQKAFKDAKIVLPQIYKKSDPEVQDWVKSHYENPYSRLRRGIIQGCLYLKELSEDTLRFNNLIKEEEKKISIEDLHDYLDVLVNSLPLREPETPAALYKLFIRTLSHEWEAATLVMKELRAERRAFSWTMKLTRNWLAHSKTFNQLSAQDVAYLFIVNMRAMFDLGNSLLPYEKHLLYLFADAISAEKMKEKSGDNNRKIDALKNPLGRGIPLAVSYAALLNKSGNTWQAINFHDALNNLQKNIGSETDSGFLIQGLYQTFWFLTSSGKVSTYGNKVKNYPDLNYQFEHFNYEKHEFILELARHIFNRSFGDSPKISGV